MDTYFLLNLARTPLTVTLTQQVVLLFMDSFGNSSDVHPLGLQKYLQDDLQDKYIRTLTSSQFKINNQAIETKLQKNNEDCGVFVCAFAYCLCNHLGLTTFTQDDMNFFRSHMLCSIMKGKLMDLLSYPNFPFSGTEGLVRR